ncbi:MAG: hypothetical protein IT449_10785 [Phycisphaerales bacterium]|nr:hypothetical protein [Phycisphaerales bacterium]
MRLEMNQTLAQGYRSPSQIARVITEDWARRELYCPACESGEIRSLPVNSPAVDYTCPDCCATFQLKGGASWNGTKIPDAGHEAMIRAVRGGHVPNLFVLQ